MLDALSYICTVVRIFPNLIPLAVVKLDVGFLCGLHVDASLSDSMSWLSRADLMFSPTFAVWFLTRPIVQASKKTELFPQGPNHALVLALSSSADLCSSVFALCLAGAIVLDTRFQRDGTYGYSSHHVRRDRPECRHIEFGLRLLALRRSHVLQQTLPTVQYNTFFSALASLVLFLP